MEHSSINRITRAKRALGFMHKGNLGIFFREIRKRWNSTSLTIGLQRDLHDPIIPPEAKIPLNIRKLHAADVEHLMGYGQLKKTDVQLYHHQLDTLDAFFANCFVAENIHGEACFMQFLIGPQQNEKIQKHFKGVFPRLGTEEGLLTGAYLNPLYRDLGIMPVAIARIAEKAKYFGAQWVLTFVDKENIDSLKSYHRAGFTPYIMRYDRWFLFRMTTYFEPLDDDIVAEYDEIMGIPSDEEAKYSNSIRKAALVNGSI
ncbi:hypothetical protein [Gracilimonas tropica]|uniref:hypothetical protein n=1 Tax=Gracilimonas tropica TaxID=454600 RepID=UPI0003A12BEE|nr:hypothetical protein [Gracilimonas tropica]